jgi:hypothetical protein
MSISLGQLSIPLGRRLAELSFEDIDGCFLGLVGYEDHFAGFLNEGQPGATVLDHLVGGKVAIGDDERPYGLAHLGSERR